ncbi:hypothetical protein RND81_03G016700 [Saponaria officinalis]|uniref:Vacuolar ATPase assembly protein VMA22 n=1 Tax=Saponaria officinalis TaxID=3572 RepID=A0AAW1M6R5_SAPOF
MMAEEIESSDHQNQNYETKKNPKSITKSKEDKDEELLTFMDSLDSYLSLIHSLSSTLRQGWFDLASARYSMGASRVNSTLLDLKEHPAATYLEVGIDEEPHFTLCKWASTNAEDSGESTDEGSGLKHSSSIRQRHKDRSQPAAEDSSLPIDGSLDAKVDQVQKERVKSLAVFGTLVSPKLRSAQSSFETSVETLVEIANMRASMLSSFDKVRENMVNVDGVKI